MLIRKRNFGRESMSSKKESTLLGREVNVEKKVERTQKMCVWISLRPSAVRINGNIEVIILTVIECHPLKALGDVW